GLVQIVLRCAVGPGVPPPLPGHTPELGGEVLPLADAEPVQVLGPAHLAERAAGEIPALFGDVRPEIEVSEEIRRFISKASVIAVGLVTVGGGALAYVLYGEGCHHHKHVPEGSVAVALHHHAGQPGIERERGHVTSGPGQPRSLVVAGPEGPELG